MTANKTSLWNRIEQTLVGALAAAALLLGVLQVAGRYLAPSLAFTAADETIVYLLIWSVMLVGSTLVRTDSHVRPDLFVRIMPAGMRRICDVLTTATATVFLTGLAYYGNAVALVAFQLDERSTTDLQFPLWIYDAALPAGAILMAIRYAIHLVRLLRTPSVTANAVHDPMGEVGVMLAPQEAATIPQGKR